MKIINVLNLPELFVVLTGLEIAEHRYLRLCVYVGIFAAQEHAP